MKRLISRGNEREKFIDSQICKFNLNKNVDYYIHRARNNIKNLFELGRKYSLKLHNGENASVCMYTDLQNNNIRISYMIDSKKGFIYADREINGIPKGEEDILREIATAFLVLEKI